MSFAEATVKQKAQSKTWRRTLPPQRSFGVKATSQSSSK
jgi:hypothetical protein